MIIKHLIFTIKDYLKLFNRYKPNDIFSFDVLDFNLEYTILQ